MTADGLRAALETARREWERSLGNEPIDEDVPRFDAIFERAVRSWLREKAGEEPAKAIREAYREWEGIAQGFELSDELIDDVDLAVFERHLSPLFAALREKIEELENESEDHDALIRLQIKRSLPAWRAWQSATGKPSNVYPDLGALVEWLMSEVAALRVRAEEAERCAQESAEIMRRVRDSRDHLREIARKAENPYDGKRADLDTTNHIEVIRYLRAALREIGGVPKGEEKQG